MSDISPPSQDSPETAPSPQKRLDVFAAADRLWQGDLLPQTGFLHGRVQVKTHRQREAEGREEQEQSKVLTVERAPSSSLEKRPLWVPCALG